MSFTGHTQDALRCGIILMGDVESAWGAPP
jgi:hypothetical protein